MTEQPGERVVLTYASSKRRSTPQPRWIAWLAIMGSLLILALFIVSLPPAGAGALDYTRNIPLFEAVSYAWHADWGEVVRDSSRMFWFVPAALACLVAFLTLRDWRVTAATLTVATVLPALWIGPRWPLVIALSPMVVFPAVVGRSDGEDWSEGLVAMCTMGIWTLLWLLIVFCLFARTIRSSLVSSEGDVR